MTSLAASVVGFRDHVRKISGFIFAAVAAISAFLIYSRLAEHSTTVIIWQEGHQQIDGFGASAADFLDPLTPAQADFFFTSEGIGLSLLRTQIIPDRATCDAQFHKDGCSGSNGQILNGELETAKLAVARGVTVFSSPWSPPGAYKTNGSFTHGGHLLPAHYADWANEIATYTTMMANNGVPLYAVSVQNEPDLTTDYGSCMYSTQEMHDFVPYLYSALNAAGNGSTKIIIAEESTWAFDLTARAMSDAKVAPEVGIIAAHPYHGGPQRYHTGGARLWVTEVSSQSPKYDDSIGDGIGWALKIHDYLTTADVNAWVWWFLTDMPRQGEGTDNAALTGIHGDYAKRAYVTGQWSRFVRPGWSRIGVKYYFSPLRISAFKDSENKSFAIVVINPSGRPVAQSFFLKGFSTSSVTPWVTSASLSLSPQASVPVRRAGFAYTLPPQSATTFVGQTLRQLKPSL